VGWNSDPSFDPAAIDAIFAYTGGIPRRINALGTRLLLFGFLDELHHFTADEVRKVADDLDAETRTASDGLSSGETTVEDTAVIQRVAGLERRLAQQELFMKRIASAVRGFLDLRHNDAE
jgi:hypothetical protein